MSWELQEFGIVSTLPISNKTSDKLANKIVLAAIYLTQAKTIFSKAFNDKHITQEEFEIVMKSKEN